MEATETELKEERDAVGHLLPDAVFDKSKEKLLIRRLAAFLFETKRTILLPI